MSLTKPCMPKMRKPRGIPYRQCVLRRVNVVQVAYIPAQFAVVGEAVKIRQADGTWEDGWQVLSAGPEVDETYLDALRSMWRHHKEVSDI